MEYQEETFESIYVEALPMFLAHKQEVDLYGLPLDLDLDLYLKTNELGTFKFYTAREEGELIGYSAYFIYMCPHHKTSVQATQDIVYYKKEKRGNGLPFMSYCEGELKKLGVHIIKIGVPASNDWSPILLRKGFSKLETTYVKEL